MKSRFHLIPVLVVLMLGFAFGGSVLAQDAEEVNGSYIIGFETASFDGSEEAMTLTLTGVDSYIPWLLTVPYFDAGRTDAATFALSWANVADQLQGVAVLELETAIYTLQLQAPTFDATSGEMVVTGMITDTLPLGEESADSGKGGKGGKGGATLPTDLEAGTLFVQFDAGFETLLAEGASALEGVARVGRGGSDEQKARPGRRG